MSATAIAATGSVQQGVKTQPETQIQQVQQQDIANLAYTLWQQRGCPEGSPQQDWIEAEQRMRDERPSTLTR